MTKNYIFKYLINIYEIIDMHADFLNSVLRVTEGPILLKSQKKCSCFIHFVAVLVGIEFSMKKQILLFLS